MLNRTQGFRYIIYTLWHVRFRMRWLQHQKLITSFNFYKLNRCSHEPNKFFWVLLTYICIRCAKVHNNTRNYQTLSTHYLQTLVLHTLPLHNCTRNWGPFNFQRITNAHTLSYCKIVLNLKTMHNVPETQNWSTSWLNFSISAK